MKIPVSRLVRDYHYYSKGLAKAQSALEAERAQEINTKRLRELAENVAIAKERTDKLTVSINRAYELGLSDFSAEDLAVVLTGLDVRLLIMMSATDSFAGIEEFVDFQSYLIIVLDNELLDRSEEEMVTRLEMNLSSGSTLVSVVHSVLERTNIRSKLSSKLILLEAHLHEMVQNIGLLGLDMLFHHQRLNQVSVIPNVFYVKEQLKDIYASFMVHSSEESGVILSEQGQMALQNLKSIVECCQGKVKMVLELSMQDIKTTLPKLDIPIPSSPSTDLNDLGIGDLVLEHWVLTRVLKEDENTGSH